jgi:hypothetical protein
MRFQLLYPEPPPPCEELIGVEIMAPGNFRYRRPIRQALLDNPPLILNTPGSAFTPRRRPITTIDQRHRASVRF